RWSWPSRTCGRARPYPRRCKTARCRVTVAGRLPTTGVAPPPNALRVLIRQLPRSPRSAVLARLALLGLRMVQAGTQMTRPEPPIPERWIAWCLRPPGAPETPGLRAVVQPVGERAVYSTLSLGPLIGAVLA